MNKCITRLGMIGMISLCLSGCQSRKQDVKQQISEPNFENVSVHDPSIITVNDEYYIIGSHLQMAKSNDLIAWQDISRSVEQTTLFTDVYQEFKEEFAYAQTRTMWAADVIQLADGKFYLYYCLCEGTSPRSVLGVAVADNIEGPYKKQESFLWSGGDQTPSNDTYNANVDPNVIDPDVFYDKDGKLWMVYGSYSGGIFILEMDPLTGLPIDRNSYGVHLLGGNHARIEGPYMMYNQETDYYYLFTSYGGLNSDQGYNLRVARSKSVTGPFLDMAGNDMSEVSGRSGTVFDDVAIQDKGTKLIGNFIWDYGDELLDKGYMSPGHNSAFYDESLDKYFNIFHTRFPNQGEVFEVRVHQMLFNDDGWPLLVPRRYAGESLEDMSEVDLAGNYMYIKSNNFISDEIIKSVDVKISNDKVLSDLDGEEVKIELDNEEVKGYFIPIWDEYTNQQTIAFTGYNSDNQVVMLVKKN